MSKNLRQRFDFRWFFVLVLLIVAMVVGILLNINSNDNNPSKIAGLVNIDNGDQKINWDRYTLTELNLIENVNITDSGIYHITGSLSDGSITIDSGIKGEVKLILDNVSIINTTGPAISCISGDDLVIELIGDNTLKDGVSYATESDQDINGVIYSKADLTFQGDGMLKINANYQDAIVGKDDVKFINGDYLIFSKDDGIRGKDSVYITGGNFNIVSDGDSIRSTNETDPEKGFVLIEGGDINISSGDDGIHGAKTLAIQGGNINIIKSYEGFEAQKVIINGGDISIMSSDDGINAGGNPNDTTVGRSGLSNTDENCIIIINDGKIYINSSGDGIDSNGRVYFNGGSTIIDGPTNNGNGALDAGIEIAMNGGGVVAVGSSDMAETLGSNSNTFNISVYFDGAKKANTKLEIKDSDNNVIISHTSAKKFAHASIGTNKFELGKTYFIYIDNELYQEFKISDITTILGSSNYNMNMLPARR